jgi:hypothetical protein
LHLQRLRAPAQNQPAGGQLQAAVQLHCVPGRSQTGEQGRTYALTGLVTGYVSIAIGIIAIVLIVLFFGALLLGGLGYGFGSIPRFGGGMMFP